MNETDQHCSSNGRVLTFPGKQPVSEPEREPDVVEAEFVDDAPVKAALVVDQPQHDAIDLLPWQQPDDRRPIVHPALTKEHRGPALRWYAGRYTHKARYHAVRLPWYQSKTFAYSLRGAVRVTKRVTDWVTDAETKTIKNLAVRHAERNLSGGHAIYNNAERISASKVRARKIAFTAAVVLFTACGLILWFYAPWALLVAAVLLIDFLGYVGRPVDRPLIGPAVVSDQYVKLTSDMVVRALSSMGIAALAAKDAVITFPAPIQRDGEGWRAEVDLPHGTTASEVIKARSKLASGLRRPLGCVWPEGDPSVHEGRLILWVGDRDLAKNGYVRWPLAVKGRHDFFERAPFGQDPRGRPVTVPSFQHNILAGGLPGQGKTSAARVLTSADALDPTVELWIHELKGTGDLDAFECVSHRFVSGCMDEDIAYAAKSLRMLRAEVMRRAAALKLLPKDLCPDKMLTREIADKRSLRLWPLSCVIDECQNAFSHPDYGKQAGEDAEFVIRMGRALAVKLTLLTQRPDKDSLPTGVSGNVSIRFCLHVAGQVENDMILGTSSYQNGLRATILRPEIDAGIGYLKGTAPTPVVVKVAYLNQDATIRIAERARVMREKAGTLSGVAVGEMEDDRFEVASLLDDLNVVYAQCERTDRVGVWSQELCAKLAELRPDVYGGWDPDALAAALKPFAIRTVQLHMPDETGARRTRYGLKRELLDKALAVRAERRKLESS